MQGAGCGVWGMGYGVWDVGCKVRGAWCGVWGVGCRVQGAGFFLGLGVRTHELVLDADGGRAGVVVDALVRRGAWRVQGIGCRH